MSEDFFHRARTRLTLDVPPALDDPTVEAKRGDLDLDPAMWEQVGVKATRPAAVLVPVIDRGEPAVLLTLRTELPSHPGQIAFPGGKIEPQDRTPADAALREAAEEIGLAPTLIEPIGYLDLYLTFSGFRILPTVARVAPDYKLVLNVIALAAFAALFLITMRRGATDPVCGMRVDRAKALVMRHGARAHFFCSAHCRHAFEADPERYAQPTASPSGASMASHGG